MINYSFSIANFEYFLLILVRIASFVYIAPFFGDNAVPARVKTGLSAFVALFMYNIIERPQLSYVSAVGFAVLVVKEGITGLIIGFAANLIRAVCDSFSVVPLGGAQFQFDNMLSTMTKYMGDMFVIGFRIFLPVFACMMIMNCILGIMAKVAPQMNMFSVGIQLKIIAGFIVLFLIVYLIPNIANFIITEIKTMVVSIIDGMY